MEELYLSLKDKIPFNFKYIEQINNIKPKFEYEKFEINMDMYHDIEEYLGERLRETIITTAKQERESGMDAIKDEII